MFCEWWSVMKATGAVPAISLYFNTTVIKPSYFTYKTCIQTIERSIRINLKWPICGTFFPIPFYIGTHCSTGVFRLLPLEAQSRIFWQHKPALDAKQAHLSKQDISTSTVYVVFFFTFFYSSVKMSGTSFEQNFCPDFTLCSFKQVPSPHFDFTKELTTVKEYIHICLTD